MNIIIRLPNWLGDMVMSTAFVKAVKSQFPEAEIDLIAKKGIDSLVEYFPKHNQLFVFSKEEYKGLKGAWKFGKEIAAQKKYDYFFCLPDSFSSAIMAKAVNAKVTIGHKKELRSFLLTNAYNKKKNIHRVEEYIDLLQQYFKTIITPPSIELITHSIQKNKAVVLNINSEASSRRLPKEKAVSIINAIRSNISEEIILVGSNKEKAFVDEVYYLLNDRAKIINRAGTTNLSELVKLLSENCVMLTTDSGPAHLGNAAGAHTIVLFGAGNENNTAPYNKTNRTIIRLGQLSCEPCTKNECKLYGVPECLIQLNEQIIVQQVIKALNS